MGISITSTALGVAITEDDILQGSFYVDRNSVSGSALEIGNAETTEIGFLLKNYDGAWNAYSFQGADLTVNLTIGAETLKVGVFTIDTQPKSSGALQIKALDNMVKFNQPYTTALTDGATLLQILQDACTACGVTLATTTFTNSAYAAKIPTEDTTFHAVVAWVAQLAGKVAWFDEDGELNLSWYGATGFNITPNNRFEGFEHEESDITITGVVYRDENGDVTAGTSGYAFIIEGNPLLDPGDASTVVTAIYGAVGGFSYRPYAGDTLGYPHLWPLDGVTITLADGVSTAYSIITNHRYVLNSTSQISAMGETEQFYGYTPPADLLPAQKTFIQTVANSAALTAANGKNTIYYSPTQPTGGTYIPGDTWFDTDDDNRIYEWSGSAWVAVQFGENAIADLSITNVKIADSTIQAAKIGTVDAGSITAGTIDVARLGAGSITFDKLSSAAVTDITDTIDLGGRNLLKNTGASVTNANYRITFYDMGDEWPVAGETYTLSVKFTLGADRTHLSLFTPEGTVQLTTVADADKNGLGVASKSFTMSYAVGHTPADGDTSLAIYQMPSSGSAASTIEWVKLEKGNKATDWTPAPEDKLSEGVSYAGVEIDATNGFVSTATIGGNTIQTKANATDGFSIFKGASKIFGVDTDGNLFSSRLSNAETPTAWSIVGEITQGGTTRRGIFGYNSSYSSSDPGFMFLVPSYGGMTGLVQNGETIAFSDAYTSPSVVSNHYLLSLGEANGCGSLLFGAYDGAGSYEAGMDLHYNDSSGFWEFTLDVGDTPLTINDAGFRYDGEPVWYQGNVDFATGTGTSSSSAGGDTTVSFGKTFSSTPVVCANTTGANSYTCRIKSVSTTGFVLVVSGASIGFNYIAVLV